MKKLYIAPNLTCVHVESQGYICTTSPGKPQQIPINWKIQGTNDGGKNDLFGTPTEDEDAEIYAKQHDAWSTWDE